MTTSERPARATSFLAACMLLSSIALAAAAAVLMSRNGEPLAEDMFVWGMAVTFPSVGALLAARRPGNAIGWIFSAIGLSMVLGKLSQEYARYSIATDPGSLPGGPAATWFASWLWIPSLVMLLVFLPLLFPDGRLPSRRWRVIPVLVAVFGAVLLAALLMYWDRRGPLLLDGGDLPDERVANALGGAAFIGLVATCVPGSIASLITRYRRAPRETRLQLKWFTYAAVLTVVLVTVSLFVPGEPWTTILHVPVVVLLPGGAAIAILKHRLYEIDLLISRSLIYGALTGIVMVLYMATVTLAGWVFERRGAGLAGVALVALLFQPIRQRVQRGVNHLIFGQRDEPYVVVSELGRRLEASAHGDELLRGVVETVARALRLTYVAIELRRGNAAEAAVAHGTQTTEIVRFPLRHRTEEIGALVVGPRSQGEPLSRVDRRLLSDLARQVASAAYSVLASEDVRHSRERTVLALEEERRRVRRDLHDGLGPALAGIGLAIQAAENGLERSPAESRELLQKAHRDVQAAIADIRRLVYGLRPPALDQLGLVGALREQASRLSDFAGGFRVAVEAPGQLCVLPAAVEVAAYRIALEAVSNAARHSGGSACVVRIAVDGAVEIDVRDDGCGLREDAPPGVGLASMRERAAEVGGTLTVESEPGGGTHVRACLPLPEGAR